MKSTPIIYLTLLGLGLTTGLSTIEFLFDDLDQPGDGDLIIADEPQVSSFLRRTEKICVNGMWGLYTLPVYGEEDIENTVVTAVRGNSRFDCFNATVSETMSNVYSFRRLGNPVMTVDQMEYYQLSNFRFNSTLPVAASTTTLSATKVATIQSFALTGSATQWRVCNGTAAVPDNCVCLDTIVNAPFLVPNLSSFPPSEPLMTLGIFELTTDAICKTLLRPIGGAPV